MHRPSTAAAVAAATLAAVLAGCGGSGGYAPSNLTTAAATPPAAPANPLAATAAGAVKVTIENLAFGPRTVVTTVGRPVEWVNRDGVAHTVTTVDGTTIASPRLAPGASFVYVAARPGTLRYVCTIHPSTMSGEVVVRPG